MREKRRDTRLRHREKGGGIRGSEFRTRREKSESAVTENVQKPRTIIHYIIKKFKSVEMVENKPRSGHPKKLIDADERWDYVRS
ncbi:hypothetical protein NPIL_334551 [Nephila pilipes]|uniref:Uncharacterized protein n=1 Tax=Nephila pilipes TaxID=299642 RepID=A0A8X6UAI9_NEPPI|nr:hypothetical protein NPIL_334551 [Nephila pilipes]